MKFFIPLVALLLGHVQVQAESAGNKDVLVALNNVRQSLKQSAGANSCEIPQPPECSFQDYCGTLSKNASNFSLYKNAEGREIPNYPLINNVRLMEACLRQEFPETPTNDPFVYPELFAKDDPALKKLFQERMKQAQATFKDVQGQLIQYLESTRNEQNKNEIDGVIQRVKTVKMKSPDVSKDYTSLVIAGCEAPNAYYDPNDHAVTVCPQMLNLPEATLFTTLAHELGHSFDPCTITMKSEVLGAGVTAEKNPFSSTVACLQTGSSIGVKVPSEKQLLANADNELKQFIKEYGDVDPAFKQQFADKKKAISKDYNQKKFCGNFSKNLHMQESFADWIANKTLQQKLETLPDSGSKQRYAFESQGMRWIECPGLVTAATQKVKAAAMKQCDLPANAGEEPPADVPPHPKSSDRVNKILFSSEKVKKALGCQGLGSVKECP